MKQIETTDEFAKRIFFETPLYTKFEYKEYSEFQFIKEYENRIDFFNPNIKENTTFDFFRSDNIGYENTDIFDKERFTDYYFTKMAYCTRTQSMIIFIFHKSNSKNEKPGYIQKIGQYPSIADFEIAQIKNYKNVLPKEYLKEFTRAIGLAANGVGVGSFVYLRRIFEKLVEDARKRASEQGAIEETEYNKLRMTDRINTLKDYLPDFLVENSSLYGILSKGIHELEENECLENFDIVKMGIEIILDDKVVEYEKKKKREELAKRIQSIKK